ncbi:ferritin 3 heavy chain homologue [Calliopsis andreniformis]|uniref:ferritin 3 heavy chain homologue n=1 Tax=Calliopsis andreniformis TaxID=337506 RepID=UPI003FCDD5DE
MSLVRQNFHEECEQALNKQINLELYASYVYLSMAYYFDRSDVALPGIHKYFKKASDEEREHATKFMTYQNKRGGNIVLTHIESPPKSDWISAKDAMEEALVLEKKVNKSLLELHALASVHNDPNFLDFLETEYLQEQVDAIKEIADHVTNLQRVGEGLGVYVFDRELRDIDFTSKIAERQFQTNSIASNILASMINMYGIPLINSVVNMSLTSYEMSIKIFVHTLRQHVRSISHRKTRKSQLFEIICKPRKPNLGALPGKFYSTCDTDNKCNKSDKVCIDKPMKWPSEKPASFKFHEETETIFNEQINAELKAFYHYLSMAAYFGRADVALPGCESFFIQMHHEEHEHALRFLNYIQMRGGHVALCPILHPTDQDWKCPLYAFKTALDLEVEISERLVAANAVAEKHGDLNASDFIITGFMEDQMKSVNEMGRFVAVLSGIGDYALARFMFDKDLLDNHIIPKFNVLRTKLRPREPDK